MYFLISLTLYLSAFFFLRKKTKKSNTIAYGFLGAASYFLIAGLTN